MRTLFGGKMSSKEWTNAEENLLLRLKNKGLSYLEIEEIMGRSTDSLRSKFWFLIKKNKTSFENVAKVLFLDIETSLMIFSGFKTGKQYLSDTNILNDFYMVSWSAKWLGSTEILSDVLTPREVKRRDDKRICKSIWKLIDDADIIITHNGISFDMKKLNTRFVANKLGLPREYKNIDTLRLARRVFSFSSNRLDYLAKFLGVGEKREGSDYALWLRCLTGEEKALTEMQEYNKNDVVILEEVYNILKQGLIAPKKPRTGYKGEI